MCNGRMGMVATHNWDRIETMIITRWFLLSKTHVRNGAWPVATEGEREEFVRQWLEGNGNVLSLQMSPCAVSSRCPQAL